jgi:plastocyanin
VGQPPSAGADFISGPYKTFDTDEIAPGQSSKSVKFEREGEFRYYCKVHGKTMSGTIVVKARAK